MIAEIFRQDDPGYPMTWPTVIRRNSDVLLWQPGIFDWMTAMVVLLLSIIMDIRLLRVFQAQARQPVTLHGIEEL